MIQLTPGEKFVISRQLPRPTDSNTYYLRAYIRKDSTDELIATVDLEDKEEQRFRGEWYVPNYPEPNFITITTKVFTDENYTTESNLYGRTDEKYLIQQRWSMVFGGGGGGAAISYQKIKEIIQDEIKKIKIPEAKNITKYNTIQEKVEINLKPITDLIREVKNEITILGGKSNKKDFQEVLNRVGEIESALTFAIKGIKIPKEADLSPVLKEFNDLKVNLLEYVKETGETIKLAEEELNQIKEKLKKRRDIFLGKLKAETL